jgi:hypothetical protein
VVGGEGRITKKALVKEVTFFVKKVTKKTFALLRGGSQAGDRHALSVHGGHRRPNPHVTGQKFFARFFFKKALLHCLISCPPSHYRFVSVEALQELPK